MDREVHHFIDLVLFLRDHDDLFLWNLFYFELFKVLLDNYIEFWFLILALRFDHGCSGL